MGSELRVIKTKKMKTFINLKAMEHQTYSLKFHQAREVVQTEITTKPELIIINLKINNQR